MVPAGLTLSIIILSSSLKVQIIVILVFILRVNINQSNEFKARFICFLKKISHSNCFLKHCNDNIPTQVYVR